MVEVKNISFSRGTKQILNDVNLTVPEGKVTALLGPNGAGKSTLMKIMSGELQADKGGIIINSKPLTEWDTVELAKYRAVMPQKSSLTFDFKVLDVVLMGRTPHNHGVDTKEDLKIAIKNLQEVECLQLKDRSFPTLSGGEQQRVSFARVLTQLQSEVSPKNLLLDEPVSSLDPEHQLKTLELARKRADEGAAVFVILHDLNMAAAYADQVALLYGGRLHCNDIPEKVITPEIIREVFKIDVDIIKHDQTGNLLITNARVAS
ncbi:MAG: heme ABC transporter ATP-binding protein [Lentisphaeraceae bacterium]|nr:heme ABC transporter ATP-binding protein [Lentisphaeraceae bacterium]